MDKSIESDVVCQTEPDEVSPPKQPVYKVAIDSRFPIEPVFELFQSSCKKFNFYLSEVTSSSVTAVRCESSFWSFLQCLTPSDPGTVTVVKMQIGIFHPSTLRLVVAKGLEGHRKKSTEMIYHFKIQCEKWASAQIKKHKKNKAVERSLTVRKVILVPYTEFTKILADEDTEVGRTLASFADNWMLGFPEDPLLKTKRLVEQLLEGMTVYHSTDSPKLYQHYKPFAEKYVYNRYMQDLMNHYMSSLQGMQTQFAQKAKAAREMDKHELLRKIGVKDTFVLERNTFPYEEAVQCLTNLQFLVTPHEKLSCLLEMVTLMRTVVLDYWKGRVEMLAMDDQLPVIIYIVCQCYDPYLLPQIELLKEYIDSSTGLDREHSVLTYIESAVTYITKEL